MKLSWYPSFLSYNCYYFYPLIISLIYYAFLLFSPYSNYFPSTFCPPINFSLSWPHGLNEFYNDYVCGFWFGTIHRYLVDQSVCPQLRLWLSLLQNQAMANSSGMYRILQAFPLAILTYRSPIQCNQVQEVAAAPLQWLCHILMTICSHFTIFWHSLTFRHLLLCDALWSFDWVAWMPPLSHNVTYS